MKKYVCNICGFVYDEAAGYPEAGIAPGTRQKDVPNDWDCPLCGANKEDFKEEALKPANITTSLHGNDDSSDDLRKLSSRKMSSLFSNLSKGCEKQYLSEEAELFGKLSCSKGCS